MRINPNEISIRRFSTHGSVIHFEAIWRGRRIGYAYCMVGPDHRMVFEDLHVTDDLPVVYPSIIRWLHSFGLRRRALNLRGRGVARKLLDHVIEYARSEHIQELRGSVMPQDIEQIPHLLAWYQRRGFRLTDPDGDCLSGAAKKISLALT